MNLNNESRDNDQEKNQQQFQKPGQRPGYDDDNSQHLRSDFSGDQDSDLNSSQNHDNSAADLQETERRWNDISKNYRRRYPNLTSEDVDYRDGEFDDMTERIAQRTNRSRKDVQNEIRNWDSESDSQK